MSYGKLRLGELCGYLETASGRGTHDVTNLTTHEVHLDRLRVLNAGSCIVGSTHRQLVE